MVPLSLILTVSYGAATLAHVLLTVLILANWRRHPLTWLLLLAGMAGLAWAGSGLVGWSWFGIRGLPEFLGIARDLAWCLFLQRLILYLGADGPGRLPALLRWLPGLSAGLALAGLLLLGSGTFPLPPEVLGRLVPVAQLALALAGILLVENMVLNCPPDFRWAAKYFAIGLGGLFLYDFLLYADAALFVRVSTELALARGAVAALALAVIGVAVARSAGWAPRIHVSRRIAFYSMSFLVAGCYLLVMAAAGFYARRVGGDWGDFLGVLVLFCAIGLFAVLAASGRARAVARRFLAEHFYSHRHDYRQEWRRFIDALSQDGDRADLGERVIRAIAGIFEVPEGGLWLRTPYGVSLAASWNISRWRLDGAAMQLPPDDALVARLERERALHDLTKLGEAERPDWLAQVRRAWIAVPLVHRDALVGFAVLGTPRVPTRLTEEDRQLLLLLGRQAGSYLAERTLGEELAEVRRFAAFSRRVTYATHDLKNVAAQLSLLLDNARRCKDDPAFIADMLETVRHAVDRADVLLRRIGGGLDGNGAPEPAAVADALRQAVRRAGGGGRGVRLAGSVEAMVRVDVAEFTAALDHLLANAVEAAGPRGSIVVLGRRQETAVVIEVQDDGAGMSPEFLRDGLFRPFRSGKPGGYGIGVFEVRDFAHRAGGRLEVESRPGQGTTMRLVLPADGASDHPLKQAAGLD
ncbi:XrtA/PEP-CTERM system histidine kinase PrsK [Rhodocista pekingensis]|uniref:histidine kinase n=1 Tax=Rhodocista pekingensis TaxID=201185 RepID=A0ABW2L2A1_9PROT